MPAVLLAHLPHPTDARRTVGGYYRTACGRWAGFHRFVVEGVESTQLRPLCPACQVLRDGPVVFPVPASPSAKVSADVSAEVSV